MTHRYAAKPVVFPRVEFNPLLPKNLLEQHLRVEVGDNGAVFAQGPIDEIGGHQTARARPVRDNHGGIARDMPSHVFREQARRDVEATTRSISDDNRYGSPPIEICHRLLVKRAGLVIRSSNRSCGNDQRKSYERMSDLHRSHVYLLRFPSY